MPWRNRCQRVSYFPPCSIFTFILSSVLAFRVEESFPIYQSQKVQVSNYTRPYQLQYQHLPMTSQNTGPEPHLECPICLASLILPITLSCGHTFCEPCIKSQYFSSIKQACPLCRKEIALELDKYSVNVVLEQVLKSRFGGQKDYLLRAGSAKQLIEKLRNGRYNRFKKWIKEKLPWMIILFLAYQLFKVKMDFFSFKFRHYKDKAVSLASSIKLQNSLDFKFLLFSQFMRLLFSTIAIS